MDIVTIFIVLITFLLLGVFSILAFTIVQQGQRVIIERLGAYHQTLATGLHFIYPFIDRKVATYDLKETIFIDTFTFLTEDDKKVDFDISFNYIIKDVKLYHYGVQDINRALYNLISQIAKNVILKYEANNLNRNNDLIEETTLKEVSQQVQAWGLYATKISYEKKI